MPRAGRVCFIVLSSLGGWESEGSGAVRHSCRDVKRGKRIREVK